MGTIFFCLDGAKTDLTAVMLLKVHRGMLNVLIYFNFIYICENITVLHTTISIFNIQSVRLACSYQRNNIVTAGSALRCQVLSVTQPFVQ